MGVGQIHLDVGGGKEAEAEKERRDGCLQDGQAAGASPYSSLTRILPIYRSWPRSYWVPSPGS